MQRNSWLDEKRLQKVIKQGKHLYVDKVLNGMNHFRCEMIYM